MAVSDITTVVLLPQNSISIPLKLESKIGSSYFTRDACSQLLRVMGYTFLVISGMLTFSQDCLPFGSVEEQSGRLVLPWPGKAFWSKTC